MPSLAPLPPLFCSRTAERWSIRLCAWSALSTESSYRPSAAACRALSAIRASACRPLRRTPSPFRRRANDVRSFPSVLPIALSRDSSLRPSSALSAVRDRNSPKILSLASTCSCIRHADLASSTLASATPPSRPFIARSTVASLASTLVMALPCSLSTLFSPAAAFRMLLRTAKSLSAKLRSLCPSSASCLARPKSRWAPTSSFAAKARACATLTSDTPSPSLPPRGVDRASRHTTTATTAAAEAAAERAVTIILPHSRR
mmetsp:Transcript_3758/g.9661  ORF Transcript_3758/g.9661 Transcript_3758/m.9661 type:complete len:260 (-) Transcript_3758:16-795(-)